MLAHRVLGGSSSGISISCPSLGSELIAVACAHLWSLLRQCSAFCVHTGKESPLLVHPETMVSCFLGSSRRFLDSRLASYGTLVPFRLCSHSQPQSSPWGLTSKAQALSSQPPPPQQVSRQASQAGESWSAPILCVGISLLCPPNPCCCTLLRGSKASPLPTPRPHQ